MKTIFWNTAARSDARYEISDGVETCWVSEEQISIDGTTSIESMYDVAEEYASTYDHGDADDIFAVCTITDMEDGETRSFAFDGHGEFEWNTDRQG